MAVLEIIRMGHPTLRKVARPLQDGEWNHPEIRQLVDDMVETLEAAGGVGLAAPQVNVPIRLALIRFDGGFSRYGEIPAMPLTVFINPVIHVLDEAETGSRAGYWEGCLSVPGLRGWVERPQHVRVEATDLDGKQFEIELKGFPATVVQHEFDHLDGRLYIDHIKDMSKLVFEDLVPAA